MLRCLQRVGAQAISALWPYMPAPRTPSRTADWLEVAAGRLGAWKGSSAWAGARRALEVIKAWYPGLNLAQLTTFRLEAREELVAVEDDLVKRAAAIAAALLTSLASTAASSSCASIQNVANWARSSLGYHALTNSRARRTLARAEEPFQASRQLAATSSQSAVRLGVCGADMPGQRAEIAWAPTR